MEPYCAPGWGLHHFSFLFPFRLCRHGRVKDRAGSLQTGRQGSERKACSPESHSRSTADTQQASLTPSQVFPFRTGSLCSLDFIKAFFFKGFIEFVIRLLLFYVLVLVFVPRGTWALSSLTRDQTCAPCIGKQSFNHWTTREVSQSLLLHPSVLFIDYFPLARLMLGFLLNSYTDHFI